MAEKTDAPKTEPPVTLEDIERHLTRMDNIQKRVSFYMLGFSVMITGLGLIASRVTSERFDWQTLAWLLFVAGWVVMIGVNVAARCAARRED